MLNAAFFFKGFVLEEQGHTDTQLNHPLGALCAQLTYIDNIDIRLPAGLSALLCIFLDRQIVPYCAA